MLQIYKKLLELTLFLGIGSADLKEIVGATKFGFHTLKPKETLAKENDKSNILFFLMNGTMLVKSFADNHSYSIIEEIAAPAAVQPERLFGLVQNYSKNFIAKTECSFISLNKNEVLRLADQYLIFRLNFFNLLSNKAQRYSRYVWQQEPNNIKEKFIHFLRLHCEYPAGKKILKTTMQTLADELHESRLNVSKMLNQSKENGKIQLTRSEINIPALEKMR